MAPGECPAPGCPAPADSETAELTFDGLAFIVSVKCSSGDCLEVAVEQRDDASTWSATFAAKYVEEITAKTGSFKRFAVFVRMLLSAVRRESDSVCVDLLSPADLDLLRSKRASSSAAATEQPMLQQQPAATGQGSAGHPSSTKRYLILTYAAEFDRVHYPLPLAYEEHPDPQRLKATICQLRSQLAAATRPGGMHRRAPPGPMLASAAELMKLRDENAALRLQLQGIEAAGLGAHGASTGLAADMQQLAADAQETVQDLRAMRRERDGLLAKLQAAEAALDGERSLHRRELRRRAQEVADVTGELAAAKDQVRELRMKCRELMQELDLAQRRAKVASMGAPLNARQAQSPGSWRNGAGERACVGSRADLSCGTSPGGSRYHSRDASPVPFRKAPLPGPPRSRSADAYRAAFRTSSRPGSAGRFDPTEYVKLKREREREVARRLEDTRRSARLRGPNGRSLPGSLPGTRHSTPQRSRSASRDPSADRSQHHGRSAECRGAWVDPQGRGPVPRLTERLRAAVRTTPAAQPAIPARQQRSASPGRALLEVRQRLQQYVGAQAGRTSSLPAGQSEATDGRQAASSQQQQHFRLLGASQAAAPRPHAPPSGGRHADASAEIADIDSRLQSLQSFLRAAKAGQAPAARA